MEPTQIFTLLLVAGAFYWIVRKQKGGPVKTKIEEYLKSHAIVVDVRSPEEFRNGHCEGSINLPLQTLSTRLKELDRNRPIIVCCASGNRSASAKNILEQAGFPQVINGGSWMAVDSCHSTN